MSETVGEAPRLSIKKQGYQNLYQSKTPLFKFQADANVWMHHREEVSKGGIIGDEPGLGKTLTTLAYVLRQNGQTLIVVPSSLLTVWEDQLRLHTDMDMNRVGIYHGSMRKNVIDEFFEHKIFITTYNILRSEYIKDSDTFGSVSLFHKKFQRVVFDEAHHMKNRNSQTSKAALLLRSKYMWLLTGTPQYNSLDDLFIYMRLLNVIDNFSAWRRMIPDTRKKLTLDSKFTLCNGLQTVRDGYFSQMMLARKKADLIEESHINKLDPLQYHHRVLQPYEDEAEFHRLFNEFQLQRLKVAQELHPDDEQFAMKNRSTKIVIISILKMSSADWHTGVEWLKKYLAELCNNSWDNILKEFKSHVLNKKVSEEESSESSEESSESSEDSDESSDSCCSKACESVYECPICLNPCKETASYTLNCKHKFHKSCVCTWARDHPTCPMCRAEMSLPKADIQSSSSMDYLDIFMKFRKYLENDDHSPSRKFTATIELINENPDRSFIVTSQWKSVLTEFSSLLELYDVPSLTLNGDLTQKEKHSVIERFNKDSSTRVLCITMGTGSEGLTLIKASHLVFLDRWWNHDGKEIQMANRIHRLGQKADTHAHFLYYPQSIDEPLQQFINRKSYMLGLFHEPDYEQSQMDDPVDLIAVQ